MRRPFPEGFALAALIWLSGCGSLGLNQGVPLWMIGRVDRPVHDATHRVVLSAREIMKEADMEPTLTVRSVTGDDSFNLPGGKAPEPGKLDLPEHYPAFWLDGLQPGSTLVNLRWAMLAGKDRQGRPVTLVVRIDHATGGSAVSVQVGDRGDDLAASALLDQIEDRLAHPTHAPGSPGERATLQELFGPKPAGDVGEMGKEPGP